MSDPGTSPESEWGFSFVNFLLAFIEDPGSGM